MQSYKNERWNNNQFLLQGNPGNGNKVYQKDIV